MRKFVNLVGKHSKGFSDNVTRSSVAYIGGSSFEGMPTKFVAPNVANQFQLKSVLSSHLSLQPSIPTLSFSPKKPLNNAANLNGYVKDFLAASSFTEPELAAPKVTKKREKNATMQPPPLSVNTNSIPRPLPIFHLGKSPAFIPKLTPVSLLTRLLDAVEQPIPQATVDSHKRHVPAPILDPTTTALISTNRFNKPLPLAKKTSHTIQDTTQAMSGAMLRVSPESFADLLPFLSMQNVSRIAVFHPRDLMNLKAVPFMIATIDRANNMLQLRELDGGVPTLSDLSLVSSTPEQRLVPKPTHVVTSMPYSLKATTASLDELAVLLAWRLAKAALNDPVETVSLAQIKQDFEAVCIKCKHFQMSGGMRLNHDRLYGFLADAEVAAYKAALKEPGAERQHLFIQCVADCELLERVKTGGLAKVRKSSPGLGEWLHQDLQKHAPLTHLGSVASAKMAVVTGDRVALTLNCQRDQRQTGTVVLTTTPGNETLHLHVSTRLSHFGSGDRKTQKAFARQELAFMIAEGAYALKKAAHPEKTPSELAQLIAQTLFKVNLADQALAVLLAKALKNVGIRAEALLAKAAKPPSTAVTRAHAATTHSPERSKRAEERALAKELAALYQGLATNVV